MAGIQVLRVTAASQNPQKQGVEVRGQSLGMKLSGTPLWDVCILQVGLLVGPISLSLS